MVRFILGAILFILVVRAISRFLRGVVEGAQQPGGDRAARRGVALARDPVCGTYVVPGRALATRDGNLVRYFCSKRCRDQFAKLPRDDRLTR
jgi:YHS domain-containing protein